MSLQFFYFDWLLFVFLTNFHYHIHKKNYILNNLLSSYDRRYWEKQEKANLRVNNVNFTIAIPKKKTGICICGCNGKKLHYQAHINDINIIDYRSCPARDECKHYGWYSNWVKFR